MECLHDSLGEEDISALARALVDRVPQAVVVFCAAAAGSYLGFRCARTPGPRALYER